MVEQPNAPEPREGPTRPDGTSHAESFEKPGEEAIADFERYAAHDAIAGQTNAFLSHITTSVTLYFTVTGAAWAVVSGNSIAAETSTLILILILHMLFSVGMGLGLWGISNNLIQRYNFARWMGIEFWPRIERLGQPEYSWAGI